MDRLLAFGIATLCLLPVVLVLSAWGISLPAASQESWQHVRASLLLGDAATTLLLALMVACFAAVVGVSTAWFVTRCEFPGRRLLSWLLVMPLAMPAYILAITYGSLFEFAGPLQTMLRELTGWQRDDYWFPAVRSLGGAVVMLGLATTPYVYLLARLAFASQPAEWADVALSLGKTRRQLFWQVALPAARPFIVIGLALVVMETIADLGTVQILGVPTLATAIYRTWFFMNEPYVAARIASLLLILAALILWLEQLSRRGAAYHLLRGRPQRARRALKPIKGLGVSLWCALPVMAGFVVPCLWLARMASFQSQLPYPAMMAALADSLTLAAGAAMLVVAAALVLALAERQHGSWSRAANMAASLGYAMPGVVIAVGLLIWQGLVKDITATPLLLTGTIAGLLLAYLIRFLAPAYSAIHSGYLRVPAEVDRAAVSLGTGRLALLLRVHVPMLRAPLATSALIVAIDVFKELPATLILRPFDINTLALSVLEFAGDDRPVEAAPFALLLVGVASVAVAALHKLQRNY